MPPITSDTEILFHGGTILTMTSDGRADALLVRNDRIAATGTVQECRELARAEPAEFDLAGATLMPGFVDAHCHPLMFGQFTSWVDCGWEAAPDIATVISLLGSRAERTGSGPVRGKGFHHGNVADGRMLTRHDLDQVATDREVLVFHSSGHGVIVNSFALHQRGITRETPDPRGGHFGREPDGTPNGQVWDAAADALTHREGVKIGNNGPNFHLDDDVDVLADMLANAQSILHSAGVTSVVDAQVTSRELRTYFRLRERGELTLRAEMLVISSLLEDLERLGLGSRLGDDHLAFAGIKLYVDGALTGGTARFKEPYCCDPKDHGYLYHEPNELADMVLRADRMGLQTGTHAQGDAAIEIVLAAHAAARSAGARSDARHRIEHCGAPTSEQVKLIAAYGTWPVTQPQYLYRYGDEFVRALGDRAARLTPLGEFRDAGVPLVLSSDAPVCPPSPLEAVYAAVTRRTLSGTTLAENAEPLSVHDALTAHTWGAAASVHREHAVGSLAPGLLADLVVLSADPTAVPVEELLEIVVLRTWVGGRQVYSQHTSEVAPC
ncbi:amidohydrolase [Streptomyces sp. NPDC002596]